jgi:hypothetical protein
MMPDFSVNIAGLKQPVMFFDAATCASVDTKIDVCNALSFIALDIKADM